jgi:WD40 repeat protein/serine/threonine protein kinase
MTSTRAWDDPLPLPLARRVDAICCRFEAAWKAAAADAAPPQLEAYLADVAEPARAILVRELLRVEVHYRRRAGDAPQAAEYLSRFPDLDPGWLAALVAPDATPSSGGAKSPPAGFENLATVVGEKRLLEAASEAWAQPVVPGYEILEILGRGGMGVVYKARQRTLNRIVALKMILAGGHAGLRELRRFRREAEAVAQLQHPHIVQIHEVGEHAGRLYLALEFVDGGSLDRHLAGTPQPARTAAQLVQTLARAVHHAHDCGVIHRDLKPANILLRGKSEIRNSKSETNPKPEIPMPQTSGTPCLGLGNSDFEFVSDFGFRISDFEPKITDFGLAQLSGAGATGPTRTGDVLGTPSYMAPEQAEGKRGTTGPATDIYGLGAILYELLTGRPPFRAETALETLLQVRQNEPLSPSRLQPKCSRDLETICLKCLHKEPQKRYPSALALADDLQRYLVGEPIQARPIGVGERAVKWVRRHPATAAWLGLVVLLMVLGFTGVTWYALRAEERRRDAEAAQHEAQAARDEARAALYYQLVGRAYHEWQACNLKQAEELLRLAQEQQAPGWEWSYLHGLCATDLLTLHGHAAPVSSVVFSPDGRWLASATGGWGASAPADIKLWDTATGQCVRTFQGHVAPVMGLAFHPDGRQLASASVTMGSQLPGGVMLWDVDRGHAIGPLLDRPGQVFGVAFSPDGRFLASAGFDGQVRLWDSATRKEVVTLGRHTNNVFSVAFSPDGRTVVSGGWDGAVQIYDVLTQRQQLRLVGAPDIRSVAFSPDGRHVAAASFDFTVSVWDLTRAERLLTHHVHTGPVMSVAFRPDGLALASADSTGMVQIYDALSRWERRPLRGHTGGVLGVAFSPDGTRLATASMDGTVKIWDALRDQESRSLRGSSTWISSLAYSPDGRSLAAAGSHRAGEAKLQRAVNIWDVETGKVRQSLEGHTAGIGGLAYSLDGTRLASASLDQTVRLWDAATGKLLNTLHGHTQAVTGVAFDAAGMRLASASADQTVRLWDVSLGRELHTLHGHAGPVTGVAFRPDSRHLASAGADGTVRLWDAATAQLLRSLPAHEKPVTTLAFSPDGVWLASAGADETVALWEVATGREQFRRFGHTRAVTGVAFSPDGRRLASASRDWTVKLWDVPTGAEALTLRGHLGDQLSVTFRPDGRQLAAGGSDPHRVKLWDVEVPREARTARAAQAVLAWHRDTAAACIPRRQWFAATFHLTQLLAAQPGQADLLARRGQALAELGHWDRAEADCTQAIAQGVADPEAWYVQALLRLRAGDRAGYRTVCRSALQAFAQTASADAANDVAWTCVLAPEAVDDAASVVALAERAVAADPKKHLYQNTLGAALYRAGRVEEAVRRLRESLQAHGQGGDVDDWLFLALAHQRLDHRAEARHWLDKAIRSLEDAAGPVSLWSRQLTRQLLRQEAEALLQ